MVSEDSGILAVLIMERPMCTDCLASKTSISAVDVKQLMRVMSRHLRVHADEDRCRVCGDVRAVFSLARPQ